MTFNILLGDEHFALAVNGQQGSPVTYGDVAACKYNGEIFIAECTEEQANDPSAIIKVFKVDQLSEEEGVPVSGCPSVEFDFGQEPEGDEDFEDEDEEIDVPEE